MIVFQPLVNEWLTGSIIGSYMNGIKVSLGFFQDVLIPSSNLRTPYTFDAAHKTWVWQYNSTETRQTINFFYEKNELIRFRVMSINYPVVSKEGATMAKESSMMVIGAVDRDGLGCVSWWPDSSQDDANCLNESGTA